MRRLYAIIFAFLLCCTVVSGEVYSLKSPDGKIEFRVQVDQEITYDVLLDGESLIKPSPVSMVLSGHRILGKNVQVKQVSGRVVNETIEAVVPVKSRLIRDCYNETCLEFKGGYSLEFRVYDDGAAYRFRTQYPGKITVISEEVEVCFAGDYTVYFPEETSFMTHQERLYKVLPLSEIKPEQMASLPILVKTPGGPSVAVTESDLWDYPGMYVTGMEDSGFAVKGVFPQYALEEKRENDRNIKVTKRADYLAVTTGTRAFPWRVLVIARKDADLVESQMIYKLARPLALKDTSWIKPGKVAWDWWNANNIRGVDFPAGINTATYKYYIDFAARYNLEYIILDEGWYKLGNLLDINPDIDMEELLAYAREKKVGIILWVVWKTLEDQMQEALDRFAQWGVKGIKVDFMQRDDQEVVNFYWKVAAEAAKRHLVVDFHGSYKPSGIRRAYPNVLTREGVKGLEHSKWCEDASPENAVTIPFIRMLAGPMDYTPGAMNNATKENFRPIFTQPMSQGTRCHQLAMYVIYESPLQMLADSPSNYYREQECMEFLSQVPTVWDETRVLDGQVGDYILVARRSWDTWFIGAMTDWTPRELTVDLSFLGSGSWWVKMYEDGINAHRLAIDYKKKVTDVDSSRKLTVKLAPGGGWAAMFTRK